MGHSLIKVYAAAGREVCKTVVGAVATHVDYENPLNWIKLTQQVIKGDKT